MKKTVNVNIGGAPFIVDEDAYGMLKKYLNEIEIRLDGVDDKETMQDIEIRIADIFNGAISAQSQVVDAALVKRAIAIIGSAREFGEPRRSLPDQEPAQMRKGILEYCILSIISRNDAYASSIIAELKAAEMIVVEGTLYPLLTRQKNQGLLSYRWEESPQGPPRKYYSITQKGRECLEQLDIAWSELISQIRIIRDGNR